MSEMYPMGEGRWAAVYEDGSRLFFLLIQRRGAGRPVLLKEDYLYGLTAALIHGQLCMVYCRADRRLVFVNLQSGTEVLLPAEGADVEGPFQPRLVSVADQPVVLSVWKTKENAVLNLCFPNERERTVRVWEGTRMLSYAADVAGEALWIGVSDGAETDLLIWSERDGVRSAGSRKAGQALEQAEKQWRQEKESLEEAWRKEKDSLKEEWKKEKESLEEEWQQERSTVEEERRQEQITFAEEREKWAWERTQERKGWEETFAAVNRQYEELADVAKRLQDAGKRWRERMGDIP